MPAGTASTVEHDQMAPAPQPASLGEDATSVPTPRIAAVLHAAQVDDHFVDVIHGLADQSHAPDRLILLDATAAGDLEQALSRNPGLVDSLPATTVHRVIPGGWSRSALVEAALSLPPDVAAVWFLTGRTAPAPEALRHLRATLLGSPTTGLVGPKLVEWNRPNRLQRFGIQATRAGRLRISPRPGQPDQQQFDDVTDALAVPLDGLLARREVFGELGGPSLRLTEVASDLDLGWRAHLAGHRVVLAPKALVRVADRPEYPPTGATRRDARRVALARGGPFVAPVLAVWMVVTSLLLGLGFLVLKRPARAGRELADIGAVLDPWRPIAARWRARRTTRARRGDLRGLFVGGGATFRHGVDRLHEVIVPSTAPRSLEDLSSGDPLGVALERGGTPAPPRPVGRGRDDGGGGDRRSNAAVGPVGRPHPRVPRGRADRHPGRCRDAVVLVVGRLARTRGWGPGPPGPPGWPCWPRCPGSAATSPSSTPARIPPAVPWGSRSPPPCRWLPRARTSAPES